MKYNTNGSKLSMKDNKMTNKKVFIVIICMFLSFVYFTLNHESSFTLVIVGDALITDRVLENAYNEQNKEYNFYSMFNRIAKYIKKFDLKFYNQESPISGTDFKYRGNSCYNTPSSFSDMMVNIGFNMVNLANNHAFDGELSSVNGNIYCYKSEIGAINSLNYWAEKDIYTSGSYLSEESRNRKVIKKKNGIKYAMLSYTYEINIKSEYDKHPYLVNIYDEEQVKKDIEKIRNKVDLIIVSMHWGEGNESSFVPSESQKNQAKYLSSLGVDIIIGTNPYVIQPITWINDTFVTYSLGRIISNENKTGDYRYLIGLLSELKITKVIRNGKSKIIIDNVGNELLYNYYDNNNTEIIPFSQMSEEYNMEYERLFKKYSKIVKMYNNVVINSIND